MNRGSTQWLKLVVGFMALAFCAAPVPGDVGGCGQAPKQLDAQTFFWTLQSTECERCRSCGIDTAACARACGDVLVQAEFPVDCVPLVHDGEVCLRAVQQSGCDDARAFMSDSSPSIPTECNFCPPSTRP